MRLNPNGTLSRCGHMVDAPQFSTLVEMEDSHWLHQVKHTMIKGDWPGECVRCQETAPHSIRDHAQRLDAATGQQDYLQVGGVLDNVCNAACLTCDEMHSTRIGSLKGSVFPIINNSTQFDNLPQLRIVHLDINGGEPAHSRNYRDILENLPPNLRTLRLNTNCSTVLTDLVAVVHKGIDVTVTVSCDGIGQVHEFIRWPLSWHQFYQNLMAYKQMPLSLNLWTTVSVLNQHDLPNIQKFAQHHDLDHSWAYLKRPWALSVDNTDAVARDAYINALKQARKIPQ